MVAVGGGRVGGGGVCARVWPCRGGGASALAHDAQRREGGCRTSTSVFRKDLPVFVLCYHWHTDVKGDLLTQGAQKR